jgi:hypothetical protein
VIEDITSIRPDQKLHGLNSAGSSRRCAPQGAPRRGAGGSWDLGSARRNDDGCQSLNGREADEERRDWCRSFSIGE